MKPPPKPRIPSRQPPARPLSKEQHLHWKPHFEAELKKTADELNAAVTPEERDALRLRFNDITEIIFDIDNGDMNPAYLAHCIARTANDETFRSTVKLAARSFDPESVDANKTLAEAQKRASNAKESLEAAHRARIEQGQTTREKVRTAFKETSWWKLSNKSIIARKISDKINIPVETVRQHLTQIIKEDKQG